MKKKLLIAGFGLILLSGIALIFVNANNSTGSLMSELGAKLNKHSSTADMSGSSTIYAQGKNAVVTQDEVAQAKNFYIISGLSETEAEEKAASYMMELEAMYQKAIHAGYSVTDDEVSTYIDTLKEMTASAENKDDVQKLISQFDSEEAYWDYQLEVYKKNLPIQNYVSDLQKQFYENNADTLIAEKEINEEGDISGEWETYFEQFKLDAVEEEDYAII